MQVGEARDMWEEECDGMGGNGPRWKRKGGDDDKG